MIAINCLIFVDADLKHSSKAAFRGGGSTACVCVTSDIIRSLGMEVAFVVVQHAGRPIRSIPLSNGRSKASLLHQ